MKSSSSTLSCITLEYYDSDTVIDYGPRRKRCNDFNVGILYIVSNVNMVGSRLYPFEVIQFGRFNNCPENAPLENCFGYMFFLNSIYWYLQFSNIGSNKKMFTVFSTHINTQVLISNWYSIDYTMQNTITTKNNT